MHEQFVVVAGSPRSGTSLLRTILRNSDSLFVHETEPQYILELYRRFGLAITDVQQATDFLVSHEKFPRAEVDPAELRETLKGKTALSLSEFLRTCFRLLKRTRPDAPLVLKHPPLILHLDLVKALFPNLLVIHSVRDPRANVFSQRTRWPSTSLWEAATLWRASVRAGRRWQQRGTTPYLEVRYEDLVTAPEAMCTTICEFLRIPFRPSMLTPDHVEREWNPTNPGEGSKRHYQGFEQQRIEKWKRFLTPLEVKLIEDRCRRGMAWFGYETTDPQVDLSSYVPYYFEERRRALKKSIKRMRRRLRRVAGAS
jgi:hypothetical protein